MLNVYAAEKRVRERELKDQEEAKAKKAMTAQSEGRSELNRNYNRRIIGFIRDQIVSESQPGLKRHSQTSTTLKSHHKKTNSMSNNMQKIKSSRIIIADSYPGQQTDKLQKALHLCSRSPEERAFVKSTDDLYMRNHSPTMGFREAQSPGGTSNHFIDNNMTRQDYETTRKTELISLAFKALPPRIPRAMATQNERVKESVLKNQILEPVPTGDSDLTFAKVLRNSHKEKDKDLGPRRFRQCHNWEERLQQAVASPLCMKPYKRPLHLRKTTALLQAHQHALQETESKEQLMGADNADRPQCASQLIESGVGTRINTPLSGFGSGGLMKQKPKEILGHLHQKTHYKASVDFMQKSKNNDFEQLDLKDHHIVEMCKDVQKIFNKKKRREQLGRSQQMMMSGLFSPTHKTSDDFFNHRIHDDSMLNTTHNETAKFGESPRLIKPQPQGAGCNMKSSQISGLDKTAKQKQTSWQDSPFDNLQPTGGLIDQTVESIKQRRNQHRRDTSQLSHTRSQEDHDHDGSSSESEEDPQIFVEDFGEAAALMLQDSNVVRRPSFVTRGPNQRTAIMKLLQRRKLIQSQNQAFRR